MRMLFSVSLLGFIAFAVAQGDEAASVNDELPMGGLTPTQVTDLVDIHNWARRQEGASDMEQFSWNSVLAEMAQDWADKCDWRHGQPDYGNRKPYRWIGQNLWATSGRSANVTSASLAWYSEKANYDFERGTCDGVCGHYTQMVWASTNEIGCGLASCPGKQFLVCNYGPGGNYIGMKPYRKGPTCSECESGIDRCINGLCG